MSGKILVSHIQDEAGRRPWLVSMLGHLGLLVVLTLGAGFCSPRIIELGSGMGGGQGGEVISVGLTPELSGGAGMYKPSIVAAPPAVAAPPRKEPAPAEPEKPALEVTAPKTKPAAKPESRPEAPRKAENEPFPPGAIPQAPKPGSGGPGGAGSGSGGGFGGGVGVSLGSGAGGTGIDSWYLRQVERRIGQNWLRTSLGELADQVRTSVSFTISSQGRIENLRIEESSGIRAVDLAAERAVRASDPLPPLPFELRRQTVRFFAHFEYPPR